MSNAVPHPESSARPQTGLPQAFARTLRETLPQEASRIALHEPEFRGNEWTYVKECLDTGWVSSAGSYVDRFERNLADCLGITHAVAVSNGTAALHLALLLADVRPGDEVLAPTMTFVATANAIAYCGAVPHFVDTDARTLGIDAEKLDAHLRDIVEVKDDYAVNRFSGRRLRALVVMHTFGHPVDLDALNAICSRHRIALIEDAAESLGSLYKGRHTGNFGLISALSFNGNKVVTTGGGGAVVTNNAELGRRAKHLSTTARIHDAYSFVHDEIGYNYRLPNINAALGCAQLERLADFIDRKRALAARYCSAFASLPGLSFFSEPGYARSNYWLNAVLLDQPSIDQRNALIVAAHDAGFEVRPLWRLMHKLPMYATCPHMDLSCAEQIEARLVCLPSSPRLAEQYG